MISKLTHEKWVCLSSITWHEAKVEELGLVALIVRGNGCCEAVYQHIFSVRRFLRGRMHSLHTRIGSEAMTRAVVQMMV